MIAPVVGNGNGTEPEGSLAGLLWPAARSSALLPLSILAMLSLLLVACGERSEPTGTTVRLYPVQVESSDGRSTELARAPRLVAVQGAGPATMVHALGTTPLVIQADETRPPAALGSGSLLVVTPTAGRSLLTGARAARIPVYVAAVDSIDHVERSISDLGLLLGKPLQARAIVSGISRERAAVEMALAGKSAVRVFFDLGRFRTVPADSLVGDLLREAGAANVGGPDPGDAPLKPARIAQLQPEIYLTPRTSGVSLARLRRNPVIRRLPAIRDDRFVRIPSDLLIAGPRIGDGLRLIALAVHPDAFR
ncbi:MAG: ABC transporter substrate-binding protein [Gaiellaceae bacterium]